MPRSPKTEARREADRAYHERKRREQGCVPRAEYRDKALAKGRPWLAFGISETAFYARARAGVKQEAPDFVSEPTAKVVLAAFEKDERMRPRWLRQFVALVGLIAAGGSTSIDHQARAVGLPRGTARQNLLRFEWAGYVRRERFVGSKPDRYSLKLPTAEERARSLKRADLWRADMFAKPIDPSTMAALQRLLETMRGFVDDMRGRREAASEAPAEMNEDDSFDADRHRQIGIKLGFGRRPTDALVEMRRLRLNPPPAKG